MSEEETDLTCFSFHVLLILSLILITGRTVIGVSLQTDKAVLLQFKSFLQQANPINQGLYKHWNESDNTPCNWHGITCDKVRVTGISLEDSNISGGIFPDFPSLTELSYLDLSGNTIDGPIPPQLNQCSNLRYLNLSHNLIDGELNLTGLNRLETLDLTLNRLEGGICSNFPAICSSLVTLNVSLNNFTGEITNCFDECLNLKHLDLSSNHFVGDIWLGFSRLFEFSAAENNLTGAITTHDTFPSNCNLLVLDLAQNKLHGEFTNSISNCTKLTSLILSGNNFTGPVPSGIGFLPELEALYLGSNQFDREIPEQLLSLTKLAFLDLSNNSFGGEIQEIFGRFVTVRFLVLHGNSYTGGIESSGILKLHNLTRLDLSFNDFSGRLPIQIAEMPRLKFLILASNKFSGEIPPEFGNTAGLQALDLSSNSLTGPIPPTIGNLTSLLWLMLADNQLNGEIPPEIGNCSSLLWLNLANNQLSGRIPPSISDIGRNPDPTFETNRREGGVTAGSGECLAMKRWLPASYPPFSFVYTILTRKSCRVTWDRLLKGFGIFPICSNSSSFRALAISGYLQLSGNRLSGEVPPEIGKMKNLSLIHLNMNHLSGRLPPVIGQLPLVVLNVSDNGFSEDIPPELGNLKCLENLDLSKNNFSGELPASLNRLNELCKFNVSYNPLIYGVIPVTGQLATFDNGSFLGDPLVAFSSLPGNTPANSGSKAGVNPKKSPRMVAFWVFLALTVFFFAGGILSFLLCVGVRSPVNSDPDGLLLDGTKARHDMAGSTPSTWSSDNSSILSDVVKTAFTYTDIATATGNFSDDMVIGRGGFGVVYRAVLPDGRHVAVKKLQREGIEGEREFLAEMEALCSRNGTGWTHPNLVALFGWCLFGSQKLLVYEYMEGGSLEDLVSDWTRFGSERRVEVAVGVARALVYLHHECFPAVVHRDVKASNVLLDGEGRARVTDFGLARVFGPGESHVSTVVAGTVGYVAPEYGHTWRVTTKGDVYSFGVLVMELATGRRAVDGGEECLVEWGRRVWREGWEEGVRGEVVTAEMLELLRVGMRCTAEAPQARPDMKEVLDMLVKISGGGGDATGGGGDGFSSTPR